MGGPTRKREKVRKAAAEGRAMVWLPTAWFWCLWWCLWCVLFGCCKRWTLFGGFFVFFIFCFGWAGTGPVRPLHAGPEAVASRQIPKEKSSTKAKSITKRKGGKRQVEGGKSALHGAFCCRVTSSCVGAYCAPHCDVVIAVTSGGEDSVLTPTPWRPWRRAGPWRPPRRTSSPSRGRCRCHQPCRTPAPGCCRSCP